MGDVSKINTGTVVSDTVFAGEDEPRVGDKTFCGPTTRERLRNAAAASAHILTHKKQHYLREVSFSSLYEAGFLPNLRGHIHPTRDIL